MATPTPHAWSKEALLAKSQKFFEEMLKYPRGDWQYAHWSTLGLELLARAALANIHPTLLAEQKDWNNTYFALGHKPKINKFIAKSITISEVFNRLREIVTEFTTDMESSCILHMSRRKEDLHSGGSPFDALTTSKWQPQFFESCDVLAKSIDEDLAFLIGKPQAKMAATMIASSHDESAKAVKKSVSDHKIAWSVKQQDEKDKLTAQADVWATKQSGHRVKCPSCECTALVAGVPIDAPLKEIDGDEIIETQQYLPSRFGCIACGLKISSFSQLSACELGDAYKSTSTYSAAEYYAGYDQEEYGDDNNEP